MENKHIDFLKEYAKCGIVHNYMHNECDLDERIKIMNEAVAYCSTLQSEIDRLKGEKKELIEALKPFEKLAHAFLDDNDFKHNRTVYAFDDCEIDYDCLRTVLKTIKQTS